MIGEIMKCYVTSTYYDGLYSDYNKIIFYNRHQIEINNLDELYAFISECFKAGKEVIVKKEDNDTYITLEIYDDWRE